VTVVPPPQDPSDSSLATVAQIVLRMLQLYGRNGVELFREVGVAPDIAHDPHTRIPIDKLEEVFRRASLDEEDPAYGLMAARSWHPGNLGVLGHAWLSSSTLRAGLKRLERYWRIIAERSLVRLSETPAGLKLVYGRKRGDPLHEAVAADIHLSLILDMCRFNAGAALRAVEVTLRRRTPDDPGPYRRFFGCDVAFGGAENALVLSYADADAALPTSNRRLALAFDQLLTEELAGLDKDDVITRCKVALLKSLSSGELSAQEMAKGLHMSQRTLQRRLAEADTTYVNLVDRTRRDLALRLLEDRRRSFTDIAFTLGFSHQSAFVRAFRRWTGQTPSAFRDGATAAAAAL